MHMPNLKDAKIRTNKKVETKLASNLKSEKFKNKKYFIKTYGCQMNVHDSEEIKGIVENLGFSETINLEESDLVILNTCAIRENAHDKVFGFLGRVKHLKKDKPELIVCVGGCMPEQESVSNLLKEKYPFVNIVFGTHNINDLGKMILESNKKQNIEVYSVEGDIYEGMEYKRDSKYSAWVNIMYGCDKFCTYCIVPYTRGKQRSRKIEDILKEVQELKDKGYEEITLLGQNVNAYGKDLESDYGFAELLEKTAHIGISRIRFVTSHPWDFTDEMIDIIAKYDNIMPYIHLPLQSGSTNILRLMGRRYTKEEYLNLYNKIKDRIPGVSITTDIIVGFPNETDEDFNETLEVVDKCKFDGAFTFIYSPREGTPAAKIKDNINIKIKEERLQKLNEKINNYSLEHNKEYLGKKVKVLVIGASEKGEGKMCGYTETMKLVNINGAEKDLGKIIEVEITETKSFSLDGNKVIKINN
ncbi:MAG: tRNA (N6-isopentenyl adenosine(37)-C2)-methylthiotransferase MiaB [Bacilli bacterium]|jgi:tRNA-2-methylthio-N6-dimethylallyladenosine synthase|nr:tRNA (N6-isopentenyl adenosine(37)-C2)-methylthiotransferase MiaB [Bacilli bacterium]